MSTNPPEIVWSAIIDGACAPCVERAKTLILSVLRPAGADAAATVLKWWLEDASNWDDEIGEGGTEISARVMIHAPADMAGLYDVHIERQIVARGYPAEPDDFKDDVELLSATNPQELAT